jgi:hypothetical protein
MINVSDIFGCIQTLTNNFRHNSHHTRRDSKSVLSDYKSGTLPVLSLYPVKVAIPFVCSAYPKGTVTTSQAFRGYITVMVTVDTLL